MNNTLEEYLNELERYIPAALVSAPYLSRIKKIARQLPLFSAGCFECYFGNREQRVDFNISINGSRDEYRLMDNWRMNNYLNHGEQAGEPLHTIRGFCESWDKDNFNLKPFLDDLWLVYDIDDPADDNVVPWYYIRYTTVPLNHDPVFKSAIIWRTLTLLNDPLTNDLRNQLQMLFNNIPSTIFISAIGIKDHRHQKKIRIYMVMHEAREIYSLLEQIGWPGNISDLQNQVHRLADGCSDFGLAIDFDRVIQEKIGIEFWHRGEGRKNFELLTERLIQLKLCTEQQQQAFLGWEGDIELTHHTPASNSDIGLNPGSSAEGCLIQKTTPYVKIIFEAGRALAAKGYLYFDRPA